MRELLKQLWTKLTAMFWWLSRRIEDEAPKLPPKPEETASLEPATPTKETHPWEGWVWPMPVWKGEKPVISDGYGKTKRGGRGHLGVDIMYKNGSARTPNYPDQSKWFHVDQGAPMLAMGPGRVWRAGWSERGYYVQIDHGNVSWTNSDISTYYTHMESIVVRKRDIVRAGQVIGYVGADPSGPNPRHAHVEVWDYALGRSRADNTRDPEPILGELRHQEM